MPNTLESVPHEVLVMILEYLLSYTPPTYSQDLPQLTPESVKDITTTRLLGRRSMHAAHKVFAKVVQQKPIKLMPADLGQLQALVHQDSFASSMTRLLISDVLPVVEVFQRGAGGVPFAQTTMSTLDRQHWARPMAQYANLADQQTIFNPWIVDVLALIVRHLVHLEAVAIEQTTDCCVNVPAVIQEGFSRYVTGRLLQNGEARLLARDRLVVNAVLRSLESSGKKLTCLDDFKLSLVPQGVGELYDLVNTLPFVKDLALSIDSRERVFYDDEDEDDYQPDVDEESRRYDDRAPVLLRFYAIFPELETLRLDLIPLSVISLYSLLRQFDHNVAPSQPLRLHNLTKLELSVEDYEETQDGVVEIVLSYRHTLRHLGLRIEPSEGWGFQRNFSALAQGLRLDTLYVQARLPATADDPLSFMTQLPRFTQRAYFHAPYPS